MVVPLRKAEENKRNCNYDTGNHRQHSGFRWVLGCWFRFSLLSLLQCKDKYIFLAWNIKKTKSFCCGYQGKQQQKFYFGSYPRIASFFGLLLLLLLCCCFFRSKVCNILMETHCSQPEDLASSGETDLYHFELIAYIILHLLDNLLGLLGSRHGSEGQGRVSRWKWKLMTKILRYIFLRHQHVKTRMYVAI